MFTAPERLKLRERISFLALEIAHGRMSDEVYERQLASLSLALIAERLESCSELAAFSVVRLDE